MSIIPPMELDIGAGAELDIGDTSQSDSLTQEICLPRPILLGFSASSPVSVNAGSTVATDIGGPDVGRVWSLRRVFAGMPTLSLLPGQPFNSGNQPWYRSGTVTNPAALAQVFTALGPQPGYYNAVVTVGYGATAGTIPQNFSFYWGGGGSNTYNPIGPLNLLPNTTVTYNFGPLWMNNLNGVGVQVPAADTGIYVASLQLIPVPIQNYISGAVYLAPGGYGGRSYVGGDYIAQDVVYPFQARWGDNEIVLFWPMHVWASFNFPPTGNNVTPYQVLGSISVVDRQRVPVSQKRTIADITMGNGST